MVKHTAIFRAALTAALLPAGAALAEGQATFYGRPDPGGGARLPPLLGRARPARLSLTG